MAQATKHHDGLLLYGVILVIHQNIEIFQVLRFDQEGIKTLVQRLEHGQSNVFFRVCDDNPQELLKNFIQKNLADGLVRGVEMQQFSHLGHCLSNYGVRVVEVQQYNVFHHQRKVLLVE